MYYGSGLLSNYDKYYENKKAVAAKYPKRRKQEDVHIIAQEGGNENMVCILINILYVNIKSSLTF